MNIISVGKGRFINWPAIIKLLVSHSDEGAHVTVTYASGGPVTLDPAQSEILLTNVPHLLSLTGGLHINPGAIVEIQLDTTALFSDAAEKHTKVRLTLVDGAPFELTLTQSAEFLKSVQVVEQPAAEPHIMRPPTLPPPWRVGGRRHPRG